MSASKKEISFDSDREAFDRSFDFFEGQDDGNEDPWTAAAMLPSRQQKKILDTSFESDPFSAISSIKDTQASLFPDDPFELPLHHGRNVSPQSSVHTVRVGVHEQLSAFYDDTSTQGSVQVAGSIHVKPFSHEQPPGPFCLVARDLLGQMERFEVRDEVAMDVTKTTVGRTMGGGSLHETDRVLRISLPQPSLTEGVAVAHYVCTNSLRPVPMLVKSRVQSSGDGVRVGFKVRANPSNEQALRRIMIILAVPPTVDGQSIRMSRPGGMWDEMKRTVLWSVGDLEPGDAFEIQTQFTSLEAGGSASSSRPLPKFPVLVRCDYMKLFSAVEVLGDFDDGFSAPIRVMPSSFSRVLHRKV